MFTVTAGKFASSQHIFSHSTVGLCILYSHRLQKGHIRRDSGSGARFQHLVETLQG